MLWNRTGVTEINVVHRWDQRSTKKRVVFESEHHSQALQLGIKTSLFKKKMVLTKILLRLFRVYKIFYSAQLVTQKSSLGGKLGCKTMQCSCLGSKIGYISVQNYCLGCSFSEGQISFRVCFENLWSCMCTTLIFGGGEWESRHLSFILSSILYKTALKTLFCRYMFYIPVSQMTLDRCVWGTSWVQHSGVRINWYWCGRFIILCLCLYWSSTHVNNCNMHTMHI